MDELARLNEAVKQAESIYNNLSGAEGADQLLCDAAALDIQAAVLRLRSYLNRRRTTGAGQAGEKEVREIGKSASAA
jgi:hypothetical protein